MNGVLSYVLGLQAGGFISQIKQAQDSLGSFMGKAAKMTGVALLTAGAVHAIEKSFNLVEGVMGQIEKGAALEHLSKRTGESVRNLFLVQKGFTAVGLSSDNVGQSLFTMQKALGGVNEMGEDTKSVFAKMGLDIDTLRKMDAPRQLETIAKKIAGLDNEKAASFASKIFGRAGAADFLQLARSGEAFSKALKDNVEQASLFSRMGETFAKIELSLLKLKNKTKALFAGIAEGAAPGIKAVLDMLNKIDLSGIGKTIGHAITSIGQAFKEHKIGELISLSIKAGIESAVEYGEKAIAGLAAFTGALFAGLAPLIGKVMKEALSSKLWSGNADYIASAMEFMTGDAAMANYKKTGDKAYLTQAQQNYHAANVHAGQADVEATQGLRDAMRTMGEAMKEGAPVFKEAVRVAMETVHNTKGQQGSESREKLEKLLNDLFNRADKPKEGNELGKDVPNSLFDGATKTKDATNLEKMGFIFGAGGPSVLSDHAKNTAENTRGILTTVKEQTKLLAQIKINFANAA